MADLDYKRIFTAAPGLYLILSPEFIIRDANEAYLSATMTRREDILNRFLFDIFPDNPNDEQADGEKNLRSSLQFVIKHGIPHTMAVQKYDIRKPDGTFEIRYWSPINLPVYTDAGQLQCIIHRVEDVTEFIVQKEMARIARNELEQQLIEKESEIVRRSKEIQQLNGILEQLVEQRTQQLYEQNRQLERQNKELEQFTFIASHDLQEPLRTLMSFTGLILDDYGDKADKELSSYLTYIRQAASRMQLLVKGLLDYSRIGKERAPEVVNISQLLQNCLLDLKVLIEESKANIRFENLPEIKCFPAETYLLFSNLIHNAIKFKKKDLPPEIHICCTENDENWTFSIVDNGIGIKGGNEDKIFVIFKRLHNRSEYEGSGIGLAHCKKIIDLHGGEIWYESEFGSGTTFYFSIPKQS